MKFILYVLRSEERNIQKIGLSGNEKFLFSLTGRGLIKLWSFKNRQLLGVLYNSKATRSCAFSPDDTYFSFNSGRKVTVAKTCIRPSDNKVFWVIPFKLSFLFKQVIYDVLNGKTQNIDVSYFDYTICSVNLNLMHILCYINNVKQLKIAIQHEAKLLKCGTGETPLTISLNKQHFSCAEMIIKHFPTYMLENHRNSIENISCDLQRLNLTSLNSLDTLYDCLFELRTDQTLPTFGALRKEPPVILLSSSTQLDPSKFLSQSRNDKRALTDVRIEFRSSLIPFNLGLGSRESIDFFSSLSKCGNMEVFRTELIKAMLSYKWDQILWIIWLQTIVYVLLLLELTYYCVIDHSSGLNIAGLLVLNTLLLFYEILQGLSDIKLYFMTFTNILDLLRICLLYIHILAISSLGNSSGLVTLLALLNLLFWIRLIAYIRMLSSMRHLLRILVEIVKDIGPFILILFISVILFSFSFYLASERTEEFLGRVGHSYSTAYADFSIPSDRLEIIIFILASLLNPLILLSLLIAFMNDAYQHVKKQIEIVDSQELAGIILEVNRICFWGRKRGKAKYLQSCTYPAAAKKGKDFIRELSSQIGQLESKLTKVDRSLKKASGKLFALIEGTKVSGYVSLQEKVKDILRDFNLFRHSVRSSLED